MEKIVPHTQVDSIIEEGRNIARLPLHEYGSDEYAFRQLNEIGHIGAFTPLSYMSNYVSLGSPSFRTHLKCDIRSENEYLLKKYYSSKKSINQAMCKHESIANGSENSSTISEGSKSHVRLWMNKFLDDSRYMANLYEVDSSLEVHVNNQGEEEEEAEVEERDSLRTHSASSYFKHLQRLSAVDLRRTEVLKKHNLWIPLIKSDWKNTVSSAENDLKSIYDKKVCPLFIDGNEYIAGDYSLREGNISIPSIFSDHKLPAFVYHCAVELNGEVYILGGLMACHKYDDEAPSLANFHVDGIKNLPPPLLSSVVNNPSMINNGRLYVMSVRSNRLRRPELTGQVPPPLLCMEGSKLTERNIFFYGGFEIRTETNSGDGGLFLLRRRAYVNNTGYILDTLTFNFTKVELTAIPYKFVSYPTLAARFGHVQLSVPNNSYLNHQGHGDFDKNSNGSHNSSVVDGFHSDSNSPSLSLGSPPARLGNLSHNSGVYAIIIFGGYRQTGVDDYEPMNDLWRIDVPVIARGKRGYYKFGSTANANILLRLNPHSPWPSPRAFAANYITNIRDDTIKPDLLERLRENFFIDKDTFPVADKSRPLFKSLPHARPDHSDVHNLRGKVRDGNINALNDTDESIPFVKQRIASPSSGTASILQKRSKTQPYTEHEVLIIHGGSNKWNVFHDMWWYDIETETWSQIATLGKQKDSKMIPIRMGLVGHSLICVSGMAVCIGGLLQEDVNFLYFGSDYKDMRIPPQLAVGSDFMNIFDLSSQCLLEHTVTGDETNTYLVDDPDTRINIIFSCGFAVIQFDGDILLFGGLVSRRSNASNIKLGGAILKCIVPSMKLAGWLVQSGKF